MVEVAVTLFNTNQSIKRICASIKVMIIIILLAKSVKGSFTMSKGGILREHTLFLLLATRQRGGGAFILEKAPLGGSIFMA